MIQAVYSAPVLTNKHFNNSGEIVVPAKNLRMLETTSQHSATGSSSFTHLVDPGTELMILFACARHSSAPNISAASYNSVGMTLLRQRSASIATWFQTVVYYLLNPTSGANTLAVTNTSGAYLKCFAINLLGVKTDSLFRTVSDIGYGGVTTSTTLSPASTLNDIVFDVWGLRDSATWTVGAGQTKLCNLQSTNGICVSSEPGDNTATTMSWKGGSTAGCHIAFAVNGGS